MALMFLSGGGMCGGPLHHQLQGAPLVGRVITAPLYRMFSVHDRFPAVDHVGEGGAAVRGEVYDVPLVVLRDHLIPAEPPELELGLIELGEGAACLATVLRTSYAETGGLVDISEIGCWRTYLGLREVY